MEIKKILEFCGMTLVPIAMFISPFLPNIYDAVIEPDEIFVYSGEYTKNPILEWNRTMERFLKKLDAQSDVNSDSFAKPLLKKIGREVYQSLPAILSDTNFRPMDHYTVQIANMSSRYDLRNLKIHFVGCEGVDSVRTYPDTLGKR